jgi:hypothetical protein
MGSPGTIGLDSAAAPVSQSYFEFVGKPADKMLVVGLEMLEPVVAD